MSNDNKELTLGIIGCGSLGTAILGRLLVTDTHPFTKFAVNVNSSASVERLRGKFNWDGCVEIRQGGNDHVAAVSNLVILACPPGNIVPVVGDSSFREAVEGKVLVSLAAGVTLSQVSESLNKECSIARAMPNMAASVGASTTGLQFLTDGKSNFDEQKTELVESIFKAIGSVTHLTSTDHVDACTVLSGSIPAFFALFCDAMVDGAIASGVPRDKARFLISGALGSAAALLNGEDGTGTHGCSPSELRETICAMPGCTIAGIVSLEQGNVRGALTKATMEAIAKAKSLG